MPLTDLAIRKAKPGSKPIKLSDSGGLYLLISPAGSRYWRWKYRYGGKEKLMAFGVRPKPAVTFPLEQTGETDMAGSHYFEIYREGSIIDQVSEAVTGKKSPTSGQWRWRLWGGGQIIASGESYHNKEDMLKTISSIVNLPSNVEVRETK